MEKKGGSNARYGKAENGTWGREKMKKGLEGKQREQCTEEETKILPARSSPRGKAGEKQDRGNY